MIQRPCFRASYRPEAFESEGVLLLEEDGYAVLEGELAGRLASLLDGRRTVEQIVQHVAGAVAPEVVHYVLMRMEAEGHLVEGPEAAVPEAAAFWVSLEVDPEQAAQRLQQATVSVCACGSLEADAFAAVLARQGIRTAEQGALTVALTDNYLHPRLDEINRAALDTEEPWMLVKPVGKTIWLGPLFIPGETGCWACLAARLRANGVAEALVQERRGTTAPPTTSRAALPSTLQTAYHLAATEVTRWLVEGTNERLAGRLLSFDLTTLEAETHVLTRRPQCPACGVGAAPTAGPPAPLKLTSRRKGFTADGGHRVCAPEATLDGHHVSPLTGVVPYLKALERGFEDPAIHVFSSGPTAGARVETLKALRAYERNQNAGKGVSEVQARVSGLCEALERHCGLFRGDEPRRRAPYRSMRGEAIHPNACMNFSQAQYRDRTAWNAANPCSLVYVPHPFDEDAEIEWTPIWSLTQSVFRWAPTALCYSGYPPPDRPVCVADSNGNAAGNTLEEAILQGFLELVERDAVALWWYNRLRRPGVDLAGFDHPFIDHMSRCYREAGRDLWVLDLTTDFGIPTFVALSRTVEGAAEDILMGFGSHLEARLALLRALTELNQVIGPGAEQKTGQGSLLPIDQLRQTWMQTATLRSHPYLAPDPTAPLRTASDHPDLAGQDLRGDVETCVRLAAQSGLDVLVLDQTRPDVGLSVVKVMVPGLRHFWKRLGPGRLYDVPGRLGWLEQPLAETEMNPFPMFL